MKGAIEEAPIARMKRLPLWHKPFECGAQRWNIERRVELANERPPAGGEYSSGAFECRAGFVGAEPVQNVRQVYEVEPLPRRF